MNARSNLAQLALLRGEDDLGKLTICEEIESCLPKAADVRETDLAVDCRYRWR
jgi:hypothetical protein